MKNDIPTEECPICVDGKVTLWNGLTEIKMTCEWCGGTARVSETPQPTAIAGTDDAPRSSRSDEARSAFGEEPAPLCDGLVKLKRHLAGRFSEALTAMDNHAVRSEPYNNLKREIERIKKAQAGLAELMEYLESETAISPAQSAESSHR